MYGIGQLMIYGVHGVCRIKDREIRTVDRKKVEYLVLEPIGQPGSCYLVPADNPNALAKLHAVMNRDSLEEVLNSESIRQSNWIPDENVRKQYYRTLLGDCDRVALLQMIYTLEQHKKEQMAQGRKFHQCDENFLRDAERLIDSEFAIVLGIQPGEVSGYILDKLNL